MKADGILILSHCGFSFAEDLIAAAQERDLQAWIVSSLPLPEHGEQRLSTLREQASMVFATGTHEITYEDIENAISSLRARQLNVRCCITVWEGYRALMARANALLGIHDLPPSQVDDLRNKLRVRNSLADAGLSKIRARPLNPVSLEQLKRDGGRYFLKPAQGLASYGAFALRPDTQWSALEQIAAQAASDSVYSSVIGTKVNFIAEDYLPGSEFSFEVLVTGGTTYVVAIHEKCELTEARDTVLEDSCTSPPHSIDQATIAAGISWLRSVFAHLDINWGCFHVEARLDARRWDLIEINPRVGGSLISHSVKALNGQHSVLALWLDLLLSSDNDRSTESISKSFEHLLQRISYSSSGEYPHNNATFFRVYFAKAGRIESIELRQLPRSPAITQILLKAGDEILTTSREVFLGQLLWRMTLPERDSELTSLLRTSATALNIHYRPSLSPIRHQRLDSITPVLLIVDYNLTRIADVQHMAHYARTQYGAQTVLIRPNPPDRALHAVDHVIDLDPLAENFIDDALRQLSAWRPRLRAGIVFSDNAVQRGAQLLEQLGLPVDSAIFAAGAFSKHAYRKIETQWHDLFAAQHIMVPQCQAVSCIDDLTKFKDLHPTGFVLKPSCEGNNRGVVIVRPGDSLDAAFAEVSPYLHNGAVCEQLIPFQREFSFDGIGDTHFITEKVSATGRYPVEIAQILPARLNRTEKATVSRAGQLANVLVGQRQGPFHNEIKLSDDGMRAAVVEPNRRPAGMKIWTIAQAVYGIDFYAVWIDAAFGEPRDIYIPPPQRQAATVMLAAPGDSLFSPLRLGSGISLFDKALALTAIDIGLPPSDLQRLEFAWLGEQPRRIPSVPTDNADFAAQACFTLEGTDIDIRKVIAVLRERWLKVLTRESQPPLFSPSPAYAIA